MSSPAAYARAGFAAGYAEQGTFPIPPWVRHECAAVIHAAAHPLLAEASIIAGRLTGRRAALEAQREGLYGQHAKHLRQVIAPVAAAVSATDLTARARQASDPQDAHTIALEELDRATRVSGQAQPWQQANHDAATAAATLGGAVAATSVHHGHLPSTGQVRTALDTTEPGPALAITDPTAWQARQASGWATDLTRAARRGDSLDAATDAVRDALNDPAGVVWWLQDDMHGTWNAGFVLTAVNLGTAVNYMAMATACAICLDNAAGSPYASYESMPFIPAHGGCRCWSETISWADAGITSADQLT